jgi:hypothetical protein
MLPVLFFLELEVLELKSLVAPSNSPIELLHAVRPVEDDTDELPDLRRNVINFRKGGAPPL